MATEFNDKTAAEAIASNKPVVIDFWAEWCGPCRKMAPVVEELAKEYEGRVIIGKFNIEDDDCEELPSEYGIRSIPTILYFKNGELQTRTVGAQSREKLVDIIESLLA